MKLKLIGIGEVLWDLLPGGRQMGGAPANFAYHAAALGAEARVVSRVGRDEAGREVIRRLEQLGVPTCCIWKKSTAVQMKSRLTFVPNLAPHRTCQRKYGSRTWSHSYQLTDGPMMATHNLS